MMVPVERSFIHRIWLGATLRHTVRDQRQRRLGFVGNANRGSQNLAAAIDSAAVASENSSQWLPRLDHVSRTRGDDEADRRIDDVVELPSPPAHLDDAAPDGAWL